MNLIRKRRLILIACCLINLCLGSVYAWSVFASPMEKYLSEITGLSINNGDLAIVYTVANSVGPITMITGGWFNDHFGPKKVILTGGMMFAGGMILSSFAKSISFLIFSYGILTGLGLGMTYGCTISSCVKYYPDKRGVIGGITTAAYGLSSVLLPPIVTVIVEHAGITAAFKEIGIVFAIIIVLCSVFVESSPAGSIPDGRSYPANRPVIFAAANKNWKGMLSTPAFYIMIVLLTCGAFSGMMIISQASGMAQKMMGMSSIAASTVVSVLALFNAGGRIIAGFVSDRIGRINTLTIACILSVVGLLLLYLSEPGTVLTFYLGISIVGLCFGSFMGVFPGFTADQFGAENNSVNYGIMFIGFALAGYFGPTIMRNVYQSSSTYQNSFLIACSLNLAGIVLTGVFHIVSLQTSRHQSAT